MIIAIYSGKGGVGKSTTAATLTHIWRDQNPVLLDLDEQQATAVFGDSLANVDRREVEPSDVADVLASIDPARTVIIDCPPSWRFAFEAIRAADMVIVPCVTELMPLRATLTSLSNARGPERLTRVLLTRYVASDAENREVRDDAKAEFLGSIFTNRIPNSKQVRAATMVGQCVTEFMPDGPAARAYRNLAEEIQDIFQRQET